MSGALPSDRLMNNVEVKGDFAPASVKLVNKVLPNANATSVSLEVTQAGSLLEIEPQSVAITVELSDARVGTELFVLNKDNVSAKVQRTGSATFVSVSTNKVAHIVFIDGGTGNPPKAVLIAEQS